jgi:cell fate regulator YaaT (PSP1 superfamily)
MPIAVGIAFRTVARSYWYDPGDLVLEESDRVIVEAARNVEIGIVRVAAREIAQDEIQAPLKRVVRRASQGDIDQDRRNHDRAADAVRTTADSVHRHGLPMKVLSATYTFDAAQVTIEFSAENRVDFRELVKDLAGRLRCKVQLYQVGARDQAKATGGLGPCGRAFCCATFLTEFAPVSMKMAKDQSLFLNPVKFSGVCGKLMCCLRFEHETYVEARGRLPRMGETVVTPRGAGRVVELNVIKDEVTVAFTESQAQIRFPSTEIKPDPSSRCAGCTRSDHHEDGEHDDDLAE